MKHFFLLAVFLSLFVCLHARAQTPSVMPAPDHDADHDAVITGTITVNGSTQKVAAVIARLEREITGTPNTYVLVSSAISNANGVFSLTGQVGDTYRITYEFPTDGFTSSANPSTSFTATAETTAPGSGLELTRKVNTITNCGVSPQGLTPWESTASEQNIVIPKAIPTNSGVVLNSVKVFTSSQVSNPSVTISTSTTSSITQLDMGATVRIVNPFASGNLSSLETFQRFVDQDDPDPIVLVNESLTYYDISSALTKTANIVSSGNYSGTGDITFKTSAQGKITTSVEGGNISTAQVTSAIAGVCVVYTYDSEPLPVTLVSFSAKSEGNVNNLNWSTTSETNSDHFDVQRSRDGKSWRSIGTVKSQGESNEQTPYSFTDNTPVNGRNYYRLKMIDIDGTYAFSRIINVKSDVLTAAAYVYPNPAANELFVQSNTGDDIARVQVRNLNGQVVKESVKVLESMNVSKLSPGVYTVRIIHTDGSSVNQKVLIGH